MLNRRALLTLSATALIAGCATRLTPPNKLLVDLSREPDEIIPLWSNGLPEPVPDGLKEKIVERENTFGLLDRAAHNVTTPTLSLFRARRPSGSAIMIIPGGGYRWVVIDKEGYEGARLFSHMGAHVYVLRYRLPHQGWSAGADVALQDAQRAMRVIRARAARDGVVPDQITALGFSAGGHVAGMLATGFDAVTESSNDEVDLLNAKPDATALIYPVVTMQTPHAHAGSRDHLLGKTPSADRVARYSIEKRVRADMAPVFLMHAEDDAAVPSENARLLEAALRNKKVPTDLHIFQRGGHGFGLRGLEGTPLAAWSDLFWKFSQAHAGPNHA